jgi:hypothetical protein
MPDVVRRLVERRAPPFVMAASAGDQEMTHVPALRGCSRASVQMQGFHPMVCGLPGASEWPKGHCTGLCLNRVRTQDDLAQLDGLQSQGGAGTRAGHRVAAVLLVWSIPYRPSELRTSGCIRTGLSPLRVNSVLATPALGSERRQAPWESLGALIFGIALAMFI